MADKLGQYEKPRDRFENVSGETMPPFAVVKITETIGGGLDDEHALEATKPNGTATDGTFRLNMGRAVGNGKSGTLRTDGYGMWALYDNSNTPQPGEQWGPAGDWLLHQGGADFIVVGGAESFSYASGTLHRVRVMQAAGSAIGNVIYAQVNEVSGVGPGDPTFDFDNAIAIVGSVPMGGTGTGQNQYAQTYANNEWVLLFQSQDSGQWLTERGGTAGSQVIHAELTEDKTYADVAKLAKPVLADGTLDSGAPTFYLIDFEGNFYGRGPEDGGEVPGYRYHAVRITDNWQSTGKPGFRMIDGEGPAMFLVVKVAESTSQSQNNVGCTIERGPYGLPDRGRFPPPEGDFDVVVFDLLGIAADAALNELWIAIWDEEAEKYSFWRRLLEFHVVKATSPGVTRETVNFQMADPIAVNGDQPPWPITVWCDPKVDCPAGYIIYAVRDKTKHSTDVKQQWSTGYGGNFVWFLRGLTDFYPNASHSAGWQVVENYGEIEPHWHDGGPCETP